MKIVYKLLYIVKAWKFIIIKAYNQEITFINIVKI